MSHLLALDQGTTTSRAIVFDAEGRTKSIAQQAFDQIYPRPGWVEHDPSALWATQRETATEAIDGAGLSAEDITALGITNQRETTLVWNRENGRPIANAIVWQDRRTIDLCDRLKDEDREPLVQQKTGLRLDPYFSGTKLRWMLDHIEGARRSAERGELAFGTVDTWLLWNLTGGQVHATDVTNASRTLLYNIHTGTWDDELLDVLGVPRSLLPEVRPSSAIYGATRAGLFAREIPIAGVAGDQQAALFGQACTEKGMVKGTYGTGAFLLQNTAAEVMASDHNLLSTVAWDTGHGFTYALEGSIFVAGAVVQWLRDEMGLIETADEIEPLARQVDTTDGVYFVPAFTGLGAPYWDARARGLIAGLTRGSTAAHLARAGLASIAYQTADVTRAIAEDSGIATQELRVDGGAARNDLLLQMIADTLGVAVVRPQVLETTALGAAYLAGLATEVWETEEQIAARWRADRRFTPQIERARAQEQLAGWHEAVDRATTV